MTGVYGGRPDFTQNIDRHLTGKNSPAPDQNKEPTIRPKTDAIVFSKRRLETLPIPAEDRIFYRDSKTAGLNLAVRPTGHKAFYFVRWANGLTLQMLLGTFPAMSVEQARTAAAKLLGQVAAGHDPQEERRTRREEPTIKDLFDHWMLRAKAHKRPKSWGEDERQYNALLKPWANRKLSTIHKPDVQALHSKVGTENGTYTANRMLALLSAMFNRADDLGYRGSNPCKGVTRFKEQSRDRWLQGDELGRFLRHWRRNRIRMSAITFSFRSFRVPGKAMCCA